MGLSNKSSKVEDVEKELERQLGVDSVRVDNAYKTIAILEDNSYVYHSGYTSWDILISDLNKKLYESL